MKNYAKIDLIQAKGSSWIWLYMLEELALSHLF
jgi:hypothetical protein